ncbi:MAG: 50S ribosomal protein L9 [Acidobacteriota bacterium]|nr:50S ribosomal protein L9 [Acidobacteriota bacterium]
MRVILLSDQRTLGRRGEEVQVKPGFARNYLFPQGLALEANKANRAYFEQQRAKIDARHAKEREEAAAVAAQIAGITVTIAKRVGESGTLYGSVTPTAIADSLEEQGVTVDRRRLQLDGGIKSVGEHTVTIDLHPEVMAELKVNVVPAEE